MITIEIKQKTTHKEQIDDFCRETILLGIKEAYLN